METLPWDILRITLSFANVVTETAAGVTLYEGMDVRRFIRLRQVCKEWKEVVDGVRLLFEEDAMTYVSAMLVYCNRRMIERVMLRHSSSETRLKKWYDAFPGGNYAFETPCIIPGPFHGCMAMTRRGTMCTRRGMHPHRLCSVHWNSIPFVKHS